MKIILYQQLQKSTSNTLNHHRRVEVNYLYTLKKQKNKIKNRKSGSLAGSKLHILLSDIKLAFKLDGVNRMYKFDIKSHFAW